MTGYSHGIRLILLLLFLLLPGFHAGASQPPSSEAEATRLRQLSQRYATEFQRQQTPLYFRLSDQTEGPQGALNRDPDRELMGIDRDGRPIVYSVFNLASAITVRTNEVWPSQAAGYSLSGTGLQHPEIAMWDRGAVLADHVEFGGRISTGDGASEIASHSTHVAGTLIAAGVRSSARGMAWQAPLTVFDWGNDLSEMAATAAEGLIVSNHSYGPLTGWAYDSTELFWYWHGDPSISETVDYRFGYYSSNSRDYDEIAHNAPNLVIVRAAGNDRLEGPPSGSEHYVFVDEEWQLSTTTRQRDGAPWGYDALSHAAVSKNVISVGGVERINGGYRYPSDVRIASFSSYGPTDDGRIKPDVVAVGLFVESTSSTGVTDYRQGSGTSVAAPSVAGSVALLQEHFRNLHGGVNPLSSTMRGLIVHTAEEAGQNPGPDYIFGWGLMNTRRAADIITAHGRTRDRIFERTLQDGLADTILVRRTPGLPLRVTLAWTDPPGEVLPAAVDDRTPVLVNDLDLMVRHSVQNITYRPYILDPDEPDAAATTGDNLIDNVEQVYVASPADGLFKIIVSHKGTLTGGEQSYSLFLTNLSIEEDQAFPSPRYLTAGINEVSGEVRLNWAHMDRYPPGLDLLAHDDGTPGSTTQSVGTIQGTCFPIDEPCVLLEMHLWSEASRPNIPFDVFVYQMVGGVPRPTHYAQLNVLDAKISGWNRLVYPSEWFDPLPDDFLVAFRTLDSNVALGVDQQDNGYGWSRASGEWQQVPVTYFIRALVRYSNGDTAWLDPLPGNLDEFTEFKVWRDGQLVGTTDSIAFTDQLPEAGNYEYRITAGFDNGWSIASNGAEVHWDGVSVGEREASYTPERFRIADSWPNPFNAQVSAAIEIPNTQRVEVRVHDILGREVATLHQGWLVAGVHTLSWDAHHLASGVYFLRITGQDGVTSVRKMTLIR